MNSIVLCIRDKNEAKRVFTNLYRQVELLLSNGKELTVELSEVKQTRSIAQNNYYWEFCKQLADFLQEKEIMHRYEVMGVMVEKPFTSKSVHENLNKPMFDIETTTKMSVKQFCEYMDKLLIFWQEKTKNEFKMSERPESYLKNRGYEIK